LDKDRRSRPDFDSVSTGLIAQCSTSLRRRLEGTLDLRSQTRGSRDGCGRNSGRMLSASQTPTPDAQKARSHRRGASPPQFDPTNGGLTAFLLGLLFGDGGGLLDLHLAPCALKNDWIFWRYGRNVRAREGRSSSPSWRRRRILERHDPASAAHLLPRMETTKVCQLLNSRRLDWDTYLPRHSAYLSLLESP